MYMYFNSSVLFPLNNMISVKNLRGPHIRNKRKDPEIKIKVEQVLDKAKLNEREREREFILFISPRSMSSCILVCHVYDLTQ